MQYAKRNANVWNPPYEKPPCYGWDFRGGAAENRTRVRKQTNQIFYKLRLFIFLRRLE